MITYPRIFPLGDTGLTVEFGTVISRDLNGRAIALADLIDSDPFPGFVESMAAYASTTVFYDPAKVVHSGTGSFEWVRDRILGLIGGLDASTAETGRVIDIPTRFDPESGPDLAHVAEVHGLSPSMVAEIFTSVTYHVYMLGFLPGFSYMGDVDARIATERKDTPRTIVPAGSVGIAGDQAGIYSLASPGGWQLIGRTDVRLFTPESTRLTLLEPGDQVRFVVQK